MSLVEMSGIVDPWLAQESRPTIDPAQFRRTLSHFPSGVVVVTGRDELGAPAGLTCQSFMSLSLDPPLILISPSKSSRSWPRIAGGRRFAVNILRHDQQHISTLFAKSGTDKFSQVPWHSSPEDLPILDGALAVIECGLEAVHHGGDHWIVVGAVRAIGTHDGDAAEPLVFYQSAYRGLTAADQGDQSRQGAS